MKHCAKVFFLLVFFLVSLRLLAQVGTSATIPGFPQPDVPPAVADSGASDTGDSGSAGSAPATNAANPVLPAPRTQRYEHPGASGEGIDWSGLFRASGSFLAIAHSFRLLTEPGTREGLKGPFLQNYADAVSGLHGWADGDPFYVNYVGHPMQGAVAGYIWVYSDRAYRAAEFGKDPRYWKSRLRAAAFAWAESEQFEIGPVSEASIGSIQAHPPQQGFVDHVITPSIGMAWMIAEDAMDKYLVERVEGSTSNRYIRLLVRCWANPSRSFANVLQGAVPWNRTTRSGILAVPTRKDAALLSSASPYRSTQAKASPEIDDTGGAPPFEMNITFQPERFWGAGQSTLCIGGTGTAAFRIARSWQLVADVGGCKFLGLGENLSGDSLSYMAGPRWSSRLWGNWNVEAQFLAGGKKLTEERMFPELKKVLQAAAAQNPDASPRTHDQYTAEVETNGFAIAGGGGVNYRFNRALALKVAEVSYSHAWVKTLWGRDYSNSLKLTTGLVLHMGTW